MGTRLARGWRKLTGRNASVNDWAGKLAALAMFSVAECVYPTLDTA